MSKQGVQDIVRFGVVGVISTSIDIGLLALLNRVGLEKYAAVFIAYFCGALIGYYGNNSWTYRHLNQPHSVIGLSKFVAIAFVGLGFTELIVYVLTSHWSTTLLVAKLIAVAVVFFWNFFANRAVTFRQLQNA